MDNRNQSEYAKGLAAAVDGELSEFRSLQESVQKLRGSQQQLMQQLNENEMVKSELEKQDENSPVFKLVGPVLMKHELSDAKQTVEKRIEFIQGDLEKTERRIADKENEAQGVARKIQEIQGRMQEEAKGQAMEAARRAQEGQV